MNWHQSWTQKPSRVFFTLTGLLVLLAVSSLSIPLGYLPGSAKKSIMIRLEYKGAFENQIEKVITNPMEEELSKIAGIKELFSVSEQEKSSINITFFPEINLDEAYLRVREEVDYVYSALPEGVQRPVISKSDINDRPVFIAAFEKKPYLTEDYLKRVFENIKGTGEIEVGGGFKEEVRITFLPENLSLSNITLQDLISSLRSSNIIGSFGKQTDIPHTLDGRLETIESIEDLYITSSIKLKEVAEVHLTEARKESIGRVQGKEKIIIYVHKSGDANTVNLCRKLTSLIDEFPEAQVIYNYGEKIEESLGEIFISIIFGIIFVTLLTFLFIRKFYPAILVSLNIPFSTLFAVACLNGLGYEINIMTLSGIAIGIGLVIDSGIVFMEEFFSSNSEIVSTMKNAFTPIFFSSATTLAVFIPLVFARIELQDQFAGLAIAVSSSILFSIVFVFLFLPAFLLYFSKIGRGKKRKIEIAIFPYAMRIFQNLFFFINRHKFPFGGIILVLIILTAVSIPGLKQEMFSIKSGNTIFLKLEYESGSSLDYVYKTALTLEEFISQMDGIKTFSSKYEKERATFDITLKGDAPRDEIIKELATREKYFQNVFFYFPEKSETDTSFDIILTGRSNNKLRDIAYELSGSLKENATVKGIIFHFKAVLPSKLIAIDISSAAKSGVDPKTIYSKIYWSLTGPVAAKWLPKGHEADIRLSASRNFTEDIDMLLNMPIEIDHGLWVKLKDLGRVEEKEEIGRIYHYGRQRSVSFSVVTAQKQKEKALKVTKHIVNRFPFPQGYRAMVGMEEKETKRINSSSAISLILSVITILLILIFQFEDFRIPLLIIVQIPLSFILPLLFLKLFDISLSLPVMIGLILTAGISVNNSIIVFDKLKYKPLSAPYIFQVLQNKIKPILIASLTTIMGVIPLFFTGKAGQGVLAPLSLTISLGITGSILFLLVFLPLVGRTDGSALHSPENSRQSFL
ncbi:MAG: efflux RND transporter permease subunit [Planctomycetes bacterium]|nr:efflux RND transporter permease subunit [Planctomycetota bacterium]